MEYAEYIKECQRRQRAYIKGERRRMAKAQKLWVRYAVAMGQLALHPLNRMEIVDRVRELDSMAATVCETHGDSPAMRSLWELRFPVERA